MAAHLMETLSVVIPARDEEDCIESTINVLAAALAQAGIGYEILVVDDGSTDSTAEKVYRLGLRNPNIHLIQNQGRHGFGLAVRAGLEAFTGDCVAIFMADRQTARKI